MIEISPWIWAGFIVGILFFIGLDLGVFTRRPQSTSVKRALIWSGFWFGLAMLFALGLGGCHGREVATQFVTGYLIELSLSLDNILVIALIFQAFQVPADRQHRVLFCGILGALLMRGGMIGLGAVLIGKFIWTLYIFGAFLVFTGVKMIFSQRAVLNPEKNPMVRLMRQCFPIAPDFDGSKFVTQINQRRVLTPLALVLVVVESTDLLFALDSVPAVFAVTRDAFIVFSSNVFAILGLRSLYFMLAGALDYFRYLKFGLSVVLVFVGVKMLVEPHGHVPQWFQWQIPNGVSLVIIAFILSVAMGSSVVSAQREKRAAR